MAIIDVDLGSEAYRLGEIIWDYLRVQPEGSSRVSRCPAVSLIMVLGSPDLAVADRAAQLLKQGVADLAVVSGGCEISGMSGLEADIIADLIEAQGVPGDRIIRERRSQNTSEHFWWTERLLREADLFPGEGLPDFVLLIPTPVAERRALATARQRWGYPHCVVAGITDTYHDYMKRTERALALSRMVGEIDRIQKYPEFEYMLPLDEPIPAQVKAAYKRLRKDFNSRPIPDHCDILETFSATSASSRLSLAAK
jgi:DUF218 domain